MEKLSITNFRKVKNTWDFDLEPITFFTGTNNSGKSSVLKALLLLEDYVKSDNHFELVFNEDNDNKHKIDCYSNAINWFNLNGEDKKLDIEFEYKNKSNVIKLVFTPYEIEKNVISKGKLKSFELIRSNNSSLKIKYQGGDNYLMIVDSDLLKKKDEPENNDTLSNKALRLTIRNLFEENSEWINWTVNEKNLINTELDFINNEINKINPIRDFERFKEPIFENHFIDLDITRNLSALDKWEDKIEKNKKVLFGISEGHLLFLKLNYFENEKRKIDRKIIELNQEQRDLKKDLNRINKLIHKSKDASSSLQFMPEFSLSDYDNSERSFDFIIRREMSKYFRENEKELGINENRSNFSRLMILGDVVSKSLQFNIEHLSAQRNSQTRLYYNSHNSHDINKLIDIHSHNPITKKSIAYKFIKEWMEKFEIGVDYKITPIQGLASIVEVKEPNSKNWINLVDKGFGAGQIFAIILQIGLCIHSNNYWKKRLTSKSIKNYNDLIIIEEPEANLHPAFQSKLAELFLETYKEHKIRFILETHSEYVLRNSQVLLKKHNNLLNVLRLKEGSQKTIRLNEVLRKLNISTKTAVSYLAKKKIIIEAKPTTKISNIEYKMLLEEFKDRMKIDSKSFPFAVYYFEKNKGPYPMRYREDGKFIDEFGSGFFDVSANLAFDIL